MKYLYLFGLVLFLSSISKSKADSWFSPSNKSTESINRYLKSYQLLRLDLEMSRQLYDRNPTGFSLALPLPGGPVQLDFESRSIHASDFKVLNGAGKDVTATLKFPRHFRSQSSGRGKELGSLTVNSDGNLVLIYSNGKFNYNLVRLPDSLRSGQEEYILFRDSDVRMANPFHCGTEGLTSGQVQERKSIPQVPVIQNDTSCRLTEIYWECDHDMYQKGGNSIQGALNTFEAMFNGTAILFENENINIGVKAVKVWDVGDPYSYQTSFTALDDFMAAGNAANWPGQLAHLLSTRPLNLGGVAYLNAICSSFRYGFSNIDFVFNPLPLYSWTLSTIAHELGHNFSSPHTHNCNWEFPGGEVHQIDSCWNAEGDCQPVIRGRVGTIMSYCHLTGSVNLGLGFGPLPGDRIRQGFSNMSCVSGTIVIPPYTPLNSGPICDGDTLSLSAEDLSGYTYNWSGPNNFTANQRVVSIPNVTMANAGFYSLSLKKASCLSRQKKTEVKFNCMQVGQIPANFCAGAKVAVPFTSTGVFTPGNKFTVQLSNSLGQFTNPINLDTIEAFTPQSIDVTLPFSLPLGNGYKFRLLSTNPQYVGLPPDKPMIISPVGPAPSPVAASRCGPGTLSLTANGSSNILWFDSPTETVPLKISRWFETPVLSQTTSFYIQGGSTSKSKIGLPVSNSIGFDSTGNGLVFDVLSGLRLDSVLVRVRKNPTGITTGNFQIKLIKSGIPFYETPISYSISQLESDFIKIPLFWRVDPGYDYELRCEGTDFRLQVGSAVYPINQNGLITIKSSKNEPTGSVYPYFFNWVLQRFSSCPSRRVEIVAKIMNGTTPPAAQILPVNTDSLQASISAPLIQWLISGQIYSDLGSKVKGLHNLQYQVRYRLDSCWSDWSTPYVFMITSRDENLNKFSEARVYPNPAGKVLIWNGPEEITELSLFDGAGKEIWRKTVFGKENLDFSRISPGMYALRWSTSGKTQVMKVVKE